MFGVQEVRKVGVPDRSSKATSAGSKKKKKTLRQSGSGSTGVMYQRANKWLGLTMRPLLLFLLLVGVGAENNGDGVARSESSRTIGGALDHIDSDVLCQERQECPFVETGMFKNNDCICTSIAALKLILLIIVTCVSLFLGILILG